MQWVLLEMISHHCWPSGKPKPVISYVGRSGIKIKECEPFQGAPETRHVKLCVMSWASDSIVWFSCLDFGSLPTLQVGSLTVWEAWIHSPQLTEEWFGKELVRFSEAGLHTPSFSEHLDLFLLSKQLLKYGRSLKGTGQKVFQYIEVSALS